MNSCDVFGCFRLVIDCMFVIMKIVMLVVIRLNVVYGFVCCSVVFIVVCGVRMVLCVRVMLLG